MSASPSSKVAGIEPVSFTRHASDFAGFSEDLGSSFARYGFAVVSDHGLDQTHIDGVYAAAKRFFALPEDVKRRYILAGGGGQRGYTAFGVETAKGATLSDLKEFWHIGRELPAGHPYREQMPDNVWPSEVPEFHTEGLWLFNALDHLGVQILRAIAHYLALPDRYFDDTVKDGNSILRLLHYPPITAEAPNVRAGAHEDINTITLLLGAEEGGLEVLDRDGRWLPINPPPERRGVARYSMPFFLHFRPDFLIETLQSCISEGRADAYPDAITAHDFLHERLREIKLA